MSGIQRLQEAHRESLRSQLLHVNGDMNHTSNSSTIVMIKKNKDQNKEYFIRLDCKRDNMKT